jgi:hypothetical protein
VVTEEVRLILREYPTPRKLKMEPELHGGRFSERKSNQTFLSFIKIRTKILCVDNVELYQSVKSQFKIWCILGYTKIINLTNFQDLKMSTVHYIQIHPFVIFAQPNIQQITT